MVTLTTTSILPAATLIYEQREVADICCGGERGGVMKYLV